MPKVWIPSCGDGIRLVKPWSAQLTSEHRNVKVLDILAGREPGKVWRASMPAGAPVQLNAGDELVFDRVYVRQGTGSYDSVTFIVKDTSDGKLVGQRFWVKLDDANRIEAEASSSGNPVGSFSSASYITAWKAKTDPSVLQKSHTAKQKKLEMIAVHSACHDACQGGEWQRTDPRSTSVIAHHAAIIQDLLPAFQRAAKQEHAAELAQAEQWKRDHQKLQRANLHIPALHEHSARRALSTAELIDRIKRELLQERTRSRGYAAWNVVATHQNGPDTVRDLLPSVICSYRSPERVHSNLGWTVTTDAEGNVTSIAPFERKA